jgi:3-oxoacyl-[acyl-carrier-protein] synthase II
MKRRVVITGMGAVTPLGNNVAEYWKNLLAGKSGAGYITHFDASNYRVRIACELKDFDATKWMEPKEASRMDPFVHYAVASAHMAAEDAGFGSGKLDDDRAGVVIGSGIGGITTWEKEHRVMLEKGLNRVSPFLIPAMIANMATGMVSIIFGLKGPSNCTVTACATSSNALGDAFRLIQNGFADIIFAGGAEAAITPLGVSGFGNMRAISQRNDEPEKASRPFDKDRDGFVIGEGGAVLILEELEHATARKAKIYAEIIGYGMSTDAYHITAPAPGGEGMARAMTLALADSGISPQDVQYINAHGTSTPLNDLAETQAIKLAFGEHAHQLAISSTKSMVGHLLGAAGAMEAVPTILAIKEGVIHPTINYQTPDPECDLNYTPNQKRQLDISCAVSNSFAFGGHNVSLVFKKFA